MTPILGILASSISGSKAVTSSYDSIATVTLGSNASSATFSSIPSTYKHLQIRGTFIPTATDFSAVLRLNSDSAANYYAHTLYGNGASAVSDEVSAQGSYSNIRLLYSQDSTDSTTPGSFIIDILDYQNTNKYKVTRTLSGIDTNAVAQQFVFLTSGLWKSTNAVNTVTIHSATGGYGKTLGSNFATNSKFALYGIKG
jgi:hypothetical protein